MFGQYSLGEQDEGIFLGLLGVVVARSGGAEVGVATVEGAAVHHAAATFFSRRQSLRAVWLMTMGIVLLEHRIV